MLKRSIPNVMLKHRHMDIQHIIARSYFYIFCLHYTTEHTERLRYGRVGQPGPRYVLLNLRSSSKNLLKVPPAKLIGYGHRCFSFVAPSLWNSLPNNIRGSGSLSDFKTCIKTYLFNKFYNQTFGQLVNQQIRQFSQLVSQPLS